MPEVGGLPNGWKTSSIGNGWADGYYTNSLDNSFVVEGGGNGFRRTDEGHGFVYRKLKGDGSLTVRLVSTNDTFNALGIILRGSLASGSQQVGITLGGTGNRYCQTIVVYCKVRKKEYIWKRFLPKPVKYQTSRIDPKEGERLTKALVALMNEKKPYLDANIQMSDFARMLGCSTHTLSQVFTLFIKRNYYDFISEYRIEEFKRLSRDPKYAKYTITALSNQCGFRSRTPFLVAFKKFTGMTPKEWMKGEK